MGNVKGKRCKATTKSGEQCKSGASKDADFCHMHTAQATRARVEAAEVISISERLRDDDLGLSSRDERMRWLDMVWKGEIGDVRILPTGKTKKVPASMKDRLAAQAQLERMLRGEDEDGDAIDLIADRVRERLGIA